jgi:16S rRNA (guanine1207-N2)-methyltransferase
MASRDTQRYDLDLITRYVALPPAGRLLEMGYYDPRGALWAAGRGARVVALRPSVDLAAELEQRARQAALETLEVRIAVRPEPSETGSFDAALLLAPFFLGNEPVRQALLACAAAVQPAGAAYFQVHRRHGGDTFVRMARELFDEVEQLDLGDAGRRLMRASAPRPVAAHAGDVQSPADGPLHELEVRGTTVRFRLAAGVFGARGIDAGSKLLLSAVDVPRGASILDLGCGAGVIGVGLAAADPTARVVLVDSSRPATELAHENAGRNGLTNVDVRLGDGYGAVAGERFDAVVSNLPAHRGHQQDLATAERFIAGAPAHLREHGGAWFVANRALPYELPASSAFRAVRTAATDGRYKVLHGTQPRR